MDVYILGDNTDIINKIDDHLLTIKSIMSNKYIKNLKDRVIL